MTLSTQTLAEFVASAAENFAVPGIAVGVWAGGEQHFACHGVTSLENPLPVDPDTVFCLGSIAKTFTATAVLRLAAEGRVDLDAPVRRYVPELALADEAVAARITVLNLLNHTAGLDWRNIIDTGDGDDALAAHVARMTELKIIGEPGARASYSQDGFNLLGRVVENVTGQTFEQAVTAMLLEPVGLPNTAYFLNDVMTRRFAVGHNADEQGEFHIARQWKDTRANNPGGGIASTAADLLTWARFHLGDGTAADGTSILPAEALNRMKQQTVELRGSSLGDAFGLCWFLRDVEGVRTAGHGGSCNGQFGDLLLVPERDFAIVVMSNASPTGIPCDQAVIKWALEHYLGIVEKSPEPIPHDEARAAEIVGHYENDAMTFDIATDGRRLTLEVLVRPEIRAASDREMPADYAPFEFGLLPGDDDQYIVTDGALDGQRGFFTRDADGAVVGVDLAGRLFNRVGDAG